MVTITKCELVSDNGTHKEFLVTGTIDGETFSVTVMPWCGEYDYEVFPKHITDDEPIQIAIGKHFADTNTDVGLVGR